MAWVWPPAGNGVGPKALLVTQAGRMRYGIGLFRAFSAGSGGWTHLGMGILGLDAGLFALGRTDSRPRRLGPAVVGIRASSTEMLLSSSRLPSGAREA